MKQRQARWLVSSFLIILCAAGTSSSVVAAPAHYLLNPRESWIHFDAKATMHAFGGDTKALSGDLIWDAQTREIGEGTVIRIPVMNMTTGMIKRDHSLRRMFEAKEYPEIEFKALKATLIGPAPDGAAADAATARYRLDGVLKIRRVERPLSIEVTERDLAQGGLEVVGNTLVSIDWFELKPPVAFGVMRVLSEVQIQFKSVWTAA